MTKGCWIIELVSIIQHQDKSQKTESVQSIRMHNMNK